MVVNPVAGRRNAQRELTRVIRRLRATGLSVEVEPTREPGDATAWAAGLDEATTQAVVVVGGDGTIREVIEGLQGRPTPIAILPTGTENLVAKQFGFRFDAETLSRRIRTGEPRPVDVGVINGRRFLVVAGAGNRRRMAALELALRPASWPNLVRLSRRYGRARGALAASAQVLVPHGFLYSQPSSIQV